MKAKADARAVCSGKAVHSEKRRMSRQPANLIQHEAISELTFPDSQSVAEARQCQGSATACAAGFARP
jgi:hypothetical protein